VETKKFWEKAYERQKRGIKPLGERKVVETAKSCMVLTNMDSPRVKPTIKVSENSL